MPKPKKRSALGSSKKAGFAAILGELNRAEPNDICRVHDLGEHEGWLYSTLELCDTNQHAWRPRSRGRTCSIGSSRRAAVWRPSTPRVWSPGWRTA
ncbi:hypothetical protein ENSA5_30910 [Enhygromyxa salina]|uniref:Uncharacterized protein n=1 Tax=Enhygromyxa salina TaxID=215803 RepID=A0A2S9XYB3_9BACT|nr:hypothetical protein [Enhygromyxa salina]PRP97858.1 hypothetical protein ENSA5_30910 [Enhygromyxa salina]